MRKHHRRLPFSTFKLQGHGLEEYQEGHASGMPARKGALSIFFLGLITLSDKCNTKSVCPPLKTAKKNDCP